MIIDTLENLNRYVALNPRIADVVAFISKTDLKSLSGGRHSLNGDDLYVNIEDAKGRTIATAGYETHERMIDIHIPLSTSETYGYLPYADLPEASYDADRDISFYPVLEGGNYVTCRPGEFAIFFPFEGHAPCIGEGTIHKAIFKLKK